MTESKKDTVIKLTKKQVATIEIFAAITKIKQWMSPESAMEEAKRAVEVMFK